MYPHLYTAASGLISSRRELEIVADNLANVRTPGFRPARAIFAVRGGQPAPAAGPPPMTTVPIGVRLADVWHPVRTPPLRATGNPFDMAIDGRGWFQVRTPSGIRLTRAGNFTRGEGNRLVTPDGHPVLDRAGRPITLPDGTLEVAADGTLSVDGQPAGQLAVVDIPEAALVREGGTLWRSTAGTPRPIDPAGVRIRPGHLEESGVEATEELVAMIEAQRLFEMNQRLIDVTANTVARRALELAGVR
ncbi:MAG: flagellar basal-body rod protein FlgF [Acidobacteriota bacterium]